MKIAICQWTEVRSYELEIDIDEAVVKEMKENGYDPEDHKSIERYFYDDETRWWGDGSANSQAFVSVDERDLNSVEIVTYKERTL